MTKTDELLKKAIDAGFDPIKSKQFHWANQDGNLKSYASKYREVLTLEYASIKKIYLDMKYWIYLREVIFDEDDDKLKKDFFRLFDKLFTENKIVAPISIAHLSELDKIDSEKRRNTIYVMNKYSKGLCVLYYFDCFTEEIAVFFDFIFRKDKKNRLLVNYLDRISRIFGTPKPTNDFLSETENVRIQKYFYDLQSYIDLIGFLSIVDSQYNDAKAKNDLASQHNRYKPENKYASFQDAFLTEVNGMLLDTDPFILAAYNYSINPNEILTKEQLQVLKSIIVNSFKYKESETAKLLPTIFVNSSINAYFMYRPEENYEGNDIDDIWHAAISIPYCNYVLTEKKLSNIINHNNQININRYFDTIVLYSLNSVIDKLNEL